MILQLLFQSMHCESMSVMTQALNKRLVKFSEIYALLRHIIYNMPY